ncbi:MAG: riboflavin synthase [Planctomycetes bacterium]|nr:riboflavin synthase [Planctomycetota bacterium]
MFTGLVEAWVPVVAVRRLAGALDLTVDPGEAIAADLKPGGSLAVNGVCLSVTAVDGTRRSFRVIQETLQRTNLGALRVGDRVNVERALRLGDRLGGHWVQGHVDGVGILRARDSGPGQTVIRVETDRRLTRQMVPKGSICVDGISLTLVRVGPADFTCALIPETLQRTNMGHLPVGSPVNLETDVLAKYVAKLLEAMGGGLDRGKLAEHGYA